MTEPRNTDNLSTQTNGTFSRNVLHESAIARLLVQGKGVYSEYKERPLEGDDRSAEAEPPLDLSWSTRQKPQTAKVEEGSRKRRLTSPVDLERERRCTYCPFVAKDSRTLYSHYQFHRQILAGPATTSNPHLEWIHTYQKDQILRTPPQSSTPISTPMHSPGGSTHDSSSVSTLRTLLQPNNKTGHVASQSASGFLKSIVQNIIRQEITPKDSSGNSSSHVSSRSITPVDMKRSSCSSPMRIDHKNKSQEMPIDNVRLMSSLHAVAKQSNMQEDQSSPEAHKGPTHQSPNDTSRTEEFGDGYHRGVAKKHVQVKLEPEDHPGYNQMATSNTPEYQSTSTTASPRLSQPSMLNQHPQYNPQCTCSHISLSSAESRCHTPECGTHNTHNESWNSSITSSHSHHSSRIIHRQMNDKETQCDLNKETVMYSQADSASDANAECRCHHCGINFDDDVIFSIHMGCHNHKDPFLCNVCGRSCGNKYGFYTHIMRGHEYP